jgi:AraC-like DNA-binding protein
MWGSEEEKDRTVSQEIPMTTEVVRNEGSFIAKLNAILELKYTSEQYSVEDLASDLHLTPKQLRRKVTALGGGSVVHLIRKYRLEKSKVLLLSDRALSVSEVAFNCGFSDPNYFSSVFSKEYGISPTNFRKMA